MKFLGFCLVVLLIPAHPWSAAAENVSISDVRLQATSDAESDVARDITDGATLAYYGASTCVSSTAGLSVVAVFIAGGGDVVGTIPCMSVSTCAVISSNALIRIYGGPSNPPPERLIGKSPEYVTAYADVYKVGIRSERTKTAIVGSVTGCLIVTAWAFAVVPNLSFGGPG